MAISVDWPTKAITVPKADTTLVQTGPPEIRSLDINDLWLWLRDAEDGEEAMPFDETCETVPPKTISGVTLGRVLEIINSYTLEFENGTYAVNVIGGNSNLGDIMVRNSVGINTANSAGYVVVETGTSGLTAEESGWLSSVPTIETDVGSIETDVGTIQSDIAIILNNTASAFQKNVAFDGLTFTMVDVSGQPTSGLSVTGTRSLDSAAFAPLANAITEVGSTGVYTVDLAASDMNADVVTLSFTAPGAVARALTIVTTG